MWKCMFTLFVLLFWSSLNICSQQIVIICCALCDRCPFTCRNTSTVNSSTHPSTHSGAESSTLWEQHKKKHTRQKSLFVLPTHLFSRHFTRLPPTLPRRPDWSGSSAARTSPCRTPRLSASHGGCSSSGTSSLGTSDTWRGEAGGHRLVSEFVFPTSFCCGFNVKLSPLTFWRTASQTWRWSCSSCGRPGRRCPDSPSSRWPWSSLWGRFPVGQNTVTH